MSDKTNPRSLKPQAIRHFRRSTLAACVMAACSVQAQDAGDAPVVVEEELIVQGIRRSLETSQDLKREGATVKDVITASDINALPDKSIAEALQRLPGVNIERFAASDDPDHFSVEGSGVTVRGLNRVRSEFNGRDTFSADGSGGLNFSDVPPELVGAVEVNKNLTASMIEGGLAGTVNLITKKPFDAPGQQAAVTVKGTYGDLAEEVRPSATGLYSNRWDVGSNEIGFLVNLSYSDITVRSDGVGLYNYYERNPDRQIEVDGSLRSTALNRADLADQTVFMPNGAAIRQQTNYRERLGFASSLQFQNSDSSLLSTWEIVYSQTDLRWDERFVEYNEEAFQPGTEIGVQIAADREDLGYVFSANENGEFQTGIIGRTAYSPGTREQDRTRYVGDVSWNLEWSFDDNFKLETDLQYIKAVNEVEDNTAWTRFSSEVYLDVTGDEPFVDFLEPELGNVDSDLTLNGEGTGQPSKFWRAFMDHVEDSDADQFSVSADLEYSFDEGLIRAVKGGVRAARREQTIQRSTFNWGNVSENWAGGLDGRTLADIRDNDPDLLENYVFDDFQGGGVLGGANREFTFIALDQVRDSVEIRRRGVEGGYWIGSGVNLRERPGVIEGTPFLPSEVSETEENRQSLYFQVDFGSYIGDDIEFIGNTGLRYVAYDWQSTSSVSFPDISTQSDEILSRVTADEIAFADGSAFPAFTREGTDDADILPSLNLAFKFFDEYTVRFAASKALFFPNVFDLRAQASFGIRPTINREIPGDDASPITSVDIAYVGEGGNTELRPETAEQFDITFEWYFADVGSLTTAIFYKEIDDIIRSDAAVQTLTNNGVSRDVVLFGRENAGSGIVSGAEVAYQQVYDFLPGWMSGFGTQFSYTYIEENGGSEFTPSSDDRRETFRAFGGLPLEGLSKDTINLVAFYENDTFNARFAYNWRSGYLVNTRDVIAFSPIYQQGSGQLDASFLYRLNDFVQFGLEFNNLLDETTETALQYTENGALSPRNFFKNDRQVAFSVGAKF